MSLECLGRTCFSEIVTITLVNITILYITIRHIHIYSYSKAKNIVFIVVLNHYFHFLKDLFNYFIYIMSDSDIW